MRRPKSQTSKYERAPYNSETSCAVSAPSAITNSHQRHGDRSSADDDAAQRLPTFVRFADLVDANIVRNWQTLFRLIDEEGFPRGVMLGKNTRAWPLEDVEYWLAARPTARKAVPGSNNQKELETTA
jgi:hypothetical protein